MHKKHRVVLRCLLLAASFVLSPSLTTLHAGESRLKPMGEKSESRFDSSAQSSDLSDTKDKEESLSTEKKVKGNRFLMAEGRASYYSNRFHGRKTASGDHFDRREFTAAHRSLPFGTKVRVTNLANGKKVVVKINDRGPHTRNRIIDISQAAARELGMVKLGVGNVRIEAYN